jgi:hypothetical protein
MSDESISKGLHMAARKLRSGCESIDGFRDARLKSSGKAKAWEMSGIADPSLWAAYVHMGL